MKHIWNIIDLLWLPWTQRFFSSSKLGLVLAHYMNAVSQARNLLELLFALKKCAPFYLPPKCPDKDLCRSPEVPRTLEEIQMDRLANRQKNSCWKSNVKELEKGKVSHKLCWNKWSVSISCWELVWQVWLWTFSFIALTIQIGTTLQKAV